MRKVLAVILGWVVGFAVWAVLLRAVHHPAISFRIAGSVDQGLLLQAWMMSWAGPLAAALGGFAAGALSGGRGWRYGASVGVVVAFFVLVVVAGPAGGGPWLWSAPYPLAAVAASLLLGTLGGAVGRGIAQRDWAGNKQRVRLLASSFVAIPLLVLWMVHSHSAVKPAAAKAVSGSGPQVRLLRTTGSLVAIDGEVVGVDTTSGKTRKVARVSGFAIETGTLSPDGLKLAYTDSMGVGRLVILDIETGGVIAATDFIQSRNPTWSRDSESIAFECHEGGIAGVYVVRSDGSGEAERVASFPRERFTLHHRLQWSPDKQRLYMERNEKSGRHATICEIDLASGTERVIADDCMGDSWVSDGKVLIYQRELASGETVWLRREIGSAQEQHLGDDANGGYGVSPDGSRIIHWNGRSIELIGSSERAVVPEGIDGMVEIAWSADSSMCALLTSHSSRARLILVNVPDLRAQTLCTLEGSVSSPAMVVAR